MYTVIFYYDVRFTFKFDNFQSASLCAMLLNEAYPEARIDVISPSGYECEV